MSLLALTSPSLSSDPKHDFRHPHDFSGPPPFRARSPLQHHPQHQHHQSRRHRSPGVDMTTNPLRGLPPPGAISLPDPSRPPPPQQLSSLPAPPSQWHGAEDSMRVWLSAKIEDDRRRQEELKLEQRRLEERMLRDAYQSPVPPHLIPVIFAGLSGGPLAAASLDIAQQHLAQLQQQQQAAQPPPPPQYAAPVQASPDMRQDPRVPVQYMGPPPPPPHQQPPPHMPAGAAPAQAAPGQVMPQPQTGPYPPSSYRLSPETRSKPLYGPSMQQYAPHTSTQARAGSSAALPRLSTGETAAGPSSAGYGQATQQEQSPPSQSIQFQHWQPPAQSSKDSKESSRPQTNPPWRVSGHEYPSSSPRAKRKSTASHEQRPPPPTSNPATTTSPTYSQGSSGSGKSHRRHQSRDSNVQRRHYDVIERRNRSEDQGSGSREHSASGRSRSEAPSRHQTPKDGDDESRQAGDK